LHILESRMASSFRPEIPNLDRFGKGAAAYICAKVWESSDLTAGLCVQDLTTGLCVSGISSLERNRAQYLESTRRCVTLEGTRAGDQSV